MNLAKWTGLAIVLTVIYVTLVLASRQNVALRLATEWPTDLFLRLSEGQAVLPIKAKPITVVAIDDRTFEKWGVRSATTPRGKLAETLKQVLINHPMYVFVDIDLSYDTCGEAKGSNDLYNLLKDANQSAHKSQIFLYRPREATRFLRTTVIQGSPTQSTCSNEATGARIDDLVNDTGNLHWFSSTYTKDNDRIARWLSAWTIASSPSTAQPEPSIAFSAGYAVRLFEDDEGKGEIFRNAKRDVLQALPSTEAKNLAETAALKTWLTGPWAPADCKARTKRALCNYTTDTAAWLRTGLAYPADTSQVMYAYENIGLAKKTSDLRPTLGSNRPTPVLNQISAADLSKGLTGEYIKDKIVIIGRTDRDSGDFFETPLGEMAGVHVIAQSINTVASFSRPVELNLVYTAFFSAGLFLVFFLFTRVDTVEMSIFYMHILSVLAIVPIAIMYFQGTWIDIGGVLVIVGILGGGWQLLENGAVWMKRVQNGLNSLTKPKEESGR